MNLRQLEVFVAVVEAGSFSRAAELVLLTQSTISQHVAALESEIGFRLLDRTGHGVELTEGGRLLLLHARRVLAECMALRQGMAQFMGLEKAQLKIGASNVPANYLVPRLLSTLAARHPGIALSMLVGDSRDVVMRLLAGEVELAVTGSRVESDGVEYVPLAVDTLVLVVGGGHPWRKRPQVTLEELAGTAVVVRETGSGSGAAVHRALQDAGFDPSRLQVAACLGSDEAVKQAVAGGYAAAFLSSLSVIRELALSELVKVEVAGLTIDRHFWLATRRGRTPSPAAEAFAQLLVEKCGGAFRVGAARPDAPTTGRST
jgi:DNA-binding transcriptional LysR family regulator